MQKDKYIAKVLANAPTGEYYLYTDMVKALEGVEGACDAHIDVDGAAFAKTLSAREPDALEALADMSATSSRRGDYLDVLANVAAESFSEIALADGAKVHINVSSDDKSSALSVQRLVLSAEARAKADVTVHLSSKGKLVLQTKVNVAEDASVNIVFIQDGENDQTLLTRTTIDQAANSSADINFVNLNPALARNEVKCGLHAEGANLRMGGIYTVAGQNRVDNESLVEHIAGHTQSDQLFKGIADDKGVMAFSGLILVKPDAQKVDANQTNRHMLVSRDARAYAKPQLEIYADDVKCSHGATTGQIDPQQLFYMQQRGIDERTARKLLSAAFVGEVVDRIPMEEVRAALHERLIS